MAPQKRRDQVSDDLRGRANLERSGLSATQCLGMFCEKVRLRQELPAALQQVLSVRGQPEAATDVLKQDDAKLRFKCLDLPRSRGLTEVQARAGATKSTHFGGHDESAQGSKVYHRCRIRMIIHPIFAFDTTDFSANDAPIASDWRRPWAIAEVLPE